MTISAPHDLAEVRTFLGAHDLPVDDLGAVPSEIRVAIQDGVVVGSVAVERRGRAGLLRSVAVAPSVRKTGLGRQLVRAAETVARDQNLTALYLLTTGAAPFFQHLGYEPVERSSVPEAVRASDQFDRLCPASAVCMGKLLSPTVLAGTE